MVLSGPVNVGKTTTMYSIMQELAKDQRVIVSAEDPVEVRFDNINQIMIDDEKSGLSFTDVIKASMRQNPDVIAVGEIRDQITANMSMRACITGSLVFSSIHATSCINTISRLIDLGAEPYLISSSIKLILSQRLCRHLCNKCKVETKIDPEFQAIFKKLGLNTDGKFYVAKGCDFCQHTGYTSYQPIFECLPINDELAGLANKSQFTQFKKIAEKSSKAILYSILLSNFVN